jgi:hypothetical protein
MALDQPSSLVSRTGFTGSVPMPIAASQNCQTVIEVYPLSISQRHCSSSCSGVTECSLPE